MNFPSLRDTVYSNGLMTQWSYLTLLSLYRVCCAIGTGDWRLQGSEPKSLSHDTLHIQILHVHITTYTIVCVLSACMYMYHTALCICTILHCVCA